MEEKKRECCLCFDEIQYIGLGQCNHKEMCHKCHYKMRAFTVNHQCPLCNSHNMELIITDDFESDFDTYSIEHLPQFDKKSGIYAINQEVLKDLSKLVEIKCFYSGCKEGLVFRSIPMLKKHLKEDHQRYLCDICLENKTCILSEQRLYTQVGLDRHMKKGDFDEDGNIYFFHPNCPFCLKNFYDEEAIVKHMPDHFNCFICGPEHKYMYYKNYQQLEKHFRMSHYICEDQQCKEKCFIVFKTSPELEMHNNKVHNIQYAGGKRMNQNSMNIQTMTGFNFGQNEDSRIKTKDDLIKDKEGIDMEQQFLSLRKNKMKNTQIESHQDEIIDYRDFYCQKYDEKYLQQENAILQAYYKENFCSETQPNETAQTTSSTDSRGNRGGERGNRERGNNKQGAKQNDTNTNPPPVVKRKNSHKLNGEVFKEDIPLLRYHQIHDIDDEKLMNKLGLVLNQEKFTKLEEAQRAMRKKKATALEFYNVFESLVGKSIALRLFPVIAASLKQHEAIQKDMDDVYMDQIRALPSKYQTMVNSSKNYSQFFGLFRKIVEEHLTKRIKSGKLLLKLKELKMDRQRRFQFIEILRRVKTKEMGKLKFISNFGVSVEVTQLILMKIYFSDFKRVEEHLDTIPNHEFLHLFVYVSYCCDLLQGKSIQQEKQQMSVNMLKEYFVSHPDIQRDFYPKGEELDEMYNEEEEKVGIIKKSTVISKGSSAKSQQIDTQDIYEFPSIQPSTKPGAQAAKKPVTQQQHQSSKSNQDPALPSAVVDKTTAQAQKEVAKKLNTLSNWEKSNENPFLYESQDTKIRVQQVLKEEFPTLGGGKPIVPFTVPKKKVQQIFPEDEKPAPKKQAQSVQQQPKVSNEWGGPGSEAVDKYDVSNLKTVGGKKKGKNGQVQVNLAGYFL